MLLSVVAADVVDVSSVFTVVCSLFSTLFASVDGTSVFFFVDFSSVAEAGAGVTDADSATGVEAGVSS